MKFHSVELGPTVFGLEVVEDDPTVSILGEVSELPPLTDPAGSAGTSDHGALTGLGDDDHTQYHTNARGDARYEPLGTAAAAVAAHAAAGDPHPTYSTAAETAAAVAAHEADTTAVHGIANTALLETATGAQTKVDTHVNDTSAAHAATAISFAPNGTIAATTVQAAIQEVRDEAGTGSVSDAVYGAGWNGDTTVAPSKNAVYDKIETLGAGATNLTYTAATRVVASDTGTDATLTLADGSNPGLMTSADFTKLAGVEAAATADQSAAEILAKMLTVDGAGSGLDADLLDGQSSAAFEVAGAAAAAQAAAIAASQPLDSDLTAIAALTTTSYGRAFLALADAAAGRTALGLGTAATTAASAYEVAGAAAAAQAAAIAASQPLDADLTSIAALSTTSFGRSFLALADAAAARTLTGAAPLASPTFTGTVTIPTGASITAPTGLVKGDVGLGNVDNTADTAKPVSTAQQTALNLKANIASPTFTGTVTVPTPSASTDASTKAYVDGQTASVNIFARQQFK